MNSYTFWGQPFRRLIWIMPAAFALHIVEEYRGGFPAWVTHVLGGTFNELAFAFNNAAFLAIMVGLAVWASKSDSRLAAFLLIAWSSGNNFWYVFLPRADNCVVQSLFSCLITSSVLYLPISLVIGTATLQSQALSAKAFLGALVSGLCLLVFVIWYGLFHFAI